MNLSVVARNIGIALLSNAVFMFLGVIVSIVYGFDSSFSPLLLSGVITLIAGLFPLVFVRKSNSINAKEGGKSAKGVAFLAFLNPLPWRLGHCGIHASGIAFGKQFQQKTQGCGNLFAFAGKLQVQDKADNICDVFCLFWNNHSRDSLPHAGGNGFFQCDKPCLFDRGYRRFQYA